MEYYPQSDAGTTEGVTCAYLGFGLPGAITDDVGDDPDRGQTQSRPVSVLAKQVTIKKEKYD